MTERAPDALDKILHTNLVKAADDAFALLLRLREREVIGDADEIRNLGQALAFERRDSLALKARAAQGNWLAKKIIEAEKIK